MDTVCFVGYSINDPVMRYMMDALAADRLLGEAPISVYAFGNHVRGREAEAEAEWAAKNVTPILYKNHNHHALLHQTLHAWAETYRDGVRGKEAIVSNYAALRPMGSTRQDNFVGRMLWALCDESGLPAKVLADYDPLPPIEWLPALAEDRFGHRDLMRFGIRPDDAEDKKLAYSLIARPAPTRDLHGCGLSTVLIVCFRGGTGSCPILPAGWCAILTIGTPALGCEPGRSRGRSLSVLSSERTRRQTSVTWDGSAVADGSFGSRFRPL
jgi:hypothetical protein